MARIEVKQKTMKPGKKNRTKDKLKLYTLSVPPSPQVPYLHPVRHSGIIQAFLAGVNASFTMNSMGEVDFYLQLNENEAFEDYADVIEDYKLNIISEDELDISLLYDGEDSAFSLRFCLQNPMDRHILSWLVKQKKVNLYYILFFEDEYICTGLKVSELPIIFTYDLERFLNGERALLLPAFAEAPLQSNILNKNILMQNAWGFYLNYSALVRRIGNVDDTEEIVSRHILDLIACLQFGLKLKKGPKNEGGLAEELLIIWVGRRIGLFGDNEPIEYYSIYLSSPFINNDPQDPVKKIGEEALGELPELKQVAWASPLAEEGIPLIALREHLVHRFNLCNEFYYLSDRLFKEYFLPHSEYVSYYNRIINYRKLSTQGAKVYSLVKKRKDKGEVSEKDITAIDVLNLIKWGNEEDLSSIITHLHLLKPQKLEEAIIILSQKYKQIIEPQFLSLLNSDNLTLREAALIGLGLIESRKAIPVLLEKLQESTEETEIAHDALLLIGDTAIPYLRPLLDNPKANLRLRAVKVLGDIGSAEALKVLKKMPDDRSIRVENARQAFLKGLDH